MRGEEATTGTDSLCSAADTGPGGGGVLPRSRLGVGITSHQEPEDKAAPLLPAGTPTEGARASGKCGRWPRGRGGRRPRVQGGRLGLGVPPAALRAGGRARGASCALAAEPRRLHWRRGDSGVLTERCPAEPHAGWQRPDRPGSQSRPRLPAPAPAPEGLANPPPRKPSQKRGCCGHPRPGPDTRQLPAEAAGGPHGPGESGFQVRGCVSAWARTRQSLGHG